MGRSQDGKEYIDPIFIISYECKRLNYRLPDYVFLVKEVTNGVIQAY